MIAYFKGGGAYGSGFGGIFITECVAYLRSVKEYIVPITH